MYVKDILKLIEEVSPDDTAKLDEIDLAVMQFCYPNLGLRMYDHVLVDNDGCLIQPEYYTRSRDALKSIRPDGYVFRVECHSIAMDRWSCRADKVTDRIEEIATCGWIKTEEVAELHAILQAIHYERSKQTPTAPTDSDQTE